MKLLLGTLLAVASVPAMALIGTSASLTGLRYELVDLDPNDGVTPYVKFTGQSFVQAMGPYCSAVCDEKTGSFTAPAFASIYNSFATASQAGLFAGGQWGEGSVGPTGNAVLSTRSDEFNALARYQGVLGQPLFVVSANTGLRITGQYTLDAWVDPFRTPDPLRRGTEFGQARVFFNSNFIEGPAPSRAISAKSDWLSRPDFAHETGEISVLMRNDLDHQATLWGKWGVHVSGFVPGVPEPSTYALMLAGVGVLGGVARRRRARDAAASRS